VVDIFAFQFPTRSVSHRVYYELVTFWSGHRRRRVIRILRQPSQPLSRPRYILYKTKGQQKEEQDEGEGEEHQGTTRTVVLTWKVNRVEFLIGLCDCHVHIVFELLLAYCSRVDSSRCAVYIFHTQKFVTRRVIISWRVNNNNAITRRIFRWFVIFGHQWSTVSARAWHTQYVMLKKKCHDLIVSSWRGNNPVTRNIWRWISFSSPRTTRPNRKQKQEKKKRKNYELQGDEMGEGKAQRCSKRWRWRSSESFHVDQLSKSTHRANPHRCLCNRRRFITSRVESSRVDKETKTEKKRVWVIYKKISLHSSK
jgi:hypothetical protein